MEGLSSICAGLGTLEEDDNGSELVMPWENNLKDLLRFIRRDDPEKRDVFKQVCKWNIVGKDLIPIIEYCQEDRNLVLNSGSEGVGVLTMPVEPTSIDIAQQIEYLWGLKSAITFSDIVPVIVSLLESPLENLENESFTEEDWKLVQLVLTLFRNLLAIQDISTHQKAGGSATQFLALRDRFLELLFQENVMDLILVLSQHTGGSHGYLRQDNLLLLEVFYYIFKGQEPELIAKAYLKGSKVEDDPEETVSTLQSIMTEEQEKRKLTRFHKLSCYSQFSGTFTRVSLDGSKALLKGNPSASADALLKAHKNYRVLMLSIREDIEKENQEIQSSDVVMFFQAAQFVTSFQYHKCLASKIRMLDLVLKQSPEDSKEPQTARVLLYKLFYDQTEEGMTQFLLNLIKSFDTHKQSKSDLANLVESMHVVIRLLENLQARGTLRVSKRSRKKRTNKTMSKNENVCEPSVDNATFQNEVGSSICEESADINLIEKETSKVQDFDVEADRSVRDSIQLVSTDEVDFKVSSLVYALANNSVIQKLCWLLKSTQEQFRHYEPLHKACSANLFDDLELSANAIPELGKAEVTHKSGGNGLFEEQQWGYDPFEGKSQKLAQSHGEQNETSKSNPNKAVDGSEISDRHGRGDLKEPDRISKRGSRLVLSDEMERRLKDLYEKYKDNQDCCQLIAGELDLNGDISKMRVAKTLKQLGFKVPARAKMQRSNVSVQLGTNKRDLTRGSITAEESSSLRKPTHSRKRVHAFSVDEEQKIKDLFEQFKDHKRCSYMIANALDGTGSISAARVSRKLKQLGLVGARNKRSHADKHLKDEDFSDISSEGAGKSDDETLFSRRNRGKQKRNEGHYDEEHSMKIAQKLPEDVSDDELLCSMLVYVCLSSSLLFSMDSGVLTLVEKKERKGPRENDDDEHMTDSFERNLVEANSIDRDTQSREIELTILRYLRDASGQTNQIGAVEIDTALIVDHSSDAETETIGVDNLIESDAKAFAKADDSQQTPFDDELDDELVNFEKNTEAVMTRGNSASRRRLRMVIDYEDDDE
ncbi:UNVERIFIED_CONTAM: hypothetical protein Sangu_2219900 [Sesamum angustifolium]|uniref:Timeless N-terminal domain-containing protein n=1 Tax=Sesamum angustifolium TaxID=2727405 RepID=A0AAW2LK05_9LAMI